RLFFDAIDVSDIGMVERSQHLRLTLKTNHAAGIASERFGKHLQRHIALQLHVTRTIDLTHAAGADRRGDFIRAEMGSDADGQSTTSLCLLWSALWTLPRP